MNKKKLSEMSAEEFMEYGMDDSDSENEKNVVEDKKLVIKKQKDKKTTSESSVHKKQMLRLKDKDPEFYKFLQENDEELLEFSGSDADDEDELKDEDADAGGADDGEGDSSDGDSKNLDDENDNGSKLQEIVSDDEDGGEIIETQPAKIITHEIIKAWKNSLIQKKSTKVMKVAWRAFHCAIEDMSADPAERDAKSSTKKFVVEGGTLFNSLVAICFNYSMPVLEKYLKYAKNGKSKKLLLPSSSKQWGKIKVLLKQYLLDLLQLLRLLTDPSVLKITLRHCQSLCLYYACFPKITKMFLKRLIRMWSSGDEHVRVIAFLCIRKMASLIPNLFEYSLKHLYLGFVRNSKFVNSKTKPTVVFMRNSLIEMFALNEVVTYKHAFVYIRQLAIHLRNALTTKKKDGFQTVYNWQYMNCLLLWLYTLSELYSAELKPLVYPVVQITLGVIRLIPAARYYPLRFQCIDALNNLSEKTGVYIPIASYVLEAIESKEFLKKPKSSEKPPDFNHVLKLSKSQVQTKGFQDVTIDRAFECLLSHFVFWSNSIAFPELSFPVCHRLKHLTKNSRIFKLNKDMKMLVEKAQSHVDHLSKERAGVTFSPKDVEAVRAWEYEQKEKKNGLAEFYKTWKHMKSISEKGEDVQDSEVSNRKKRKALKDEKEEKQVSQKKRKKRKQTKEVEGSSHEDDIVQDFVVSSNESDNDE